MISTYQSSIQYDHPQPTYARLETLLSAHSATLPTSDQGYAFTRATAAAALSEVYSAHSVNKALDFIQLVRLQFAGRAGVYDGFFKALKLYEEGRVELVDVLLRLMLTCENAPLLLKELNYFLPDGYLYDVSLRAQYIELQTPAGAHRHPIVVTFTR